MYLSSCATAGCISAPHSIMQENCTWRDCIAFTIHLSLKIWFKKAFYFLLLHMFTQYLLLLLLQAVLYCFKKSSLSSGNYVCCLYSHLHQVLVIETQSISQTKWHRTVSSYSRLNITDNYLRKDGSTFLLLPIFLTILTWKINFLPVVKGFETGTIVSYFLCICIFTTKSGY